MARHDAMEALRRLRALEVLLARRELAGRLDEAAGADADAPAATACIAVEAAVAERPADYAAWLPRAFAARDRAAAEQARAQAMLTATRGALAAARASEHAVETFQEMQRDAAAAKAARRAQAQLDEVASRRRRP